jgi:Septin
VENENHCDFRKLRSLLIRTFMLDLISTTEEHHYEAYRLQQMETRKYGERKVKKFNNPKFQEEEEQLRRRFTEQVKAEEARFRQWEQHVSNRVYMWVESKLMDLGVVDYGARSPEQGSRDGPQCDQVARGGARQSPGWLWTWQWTAIDGSPFVWRGGDEHCKSWPLV